MCSPPQPPGVVICRTTSADLARVDAAAAAGDDRHWPSAAAADPLCPSVKPGCDHKNHNSWKTSSPGSTGCTRCLHKTVHPCTRTAGSKMFRKVRLPCFVFLTTTTIVLIVTLLIIFISPSTFFSEKSKTCSFKKDILPGETYNRFK